MKKHEIPFREEGAAIKVKGYSYPHAWDIALSLRVSEDQAERLLNAAWESLSARFWDIEAPRLVEEIMGPSVTTCASGRSNGWLCVNITRAQMDMRRTRQFWLLAVAIDKWIKEHSTTAYVVQHIRGSQDIDFSVEEGLLFARDFVARMHARVSRSNQPVPTTLLDAYKSLTELCKNAKDCRHVDQ